MTLEIAGRSYEYHSLAKLAEQLPGVSRLPYSLRILLENLLRTEDGVAVTQADILALAGWQPQLEPSVEIAFTPARVLLQDFTGVPAMVDLAAMRDAMRVIGGDPAAINPLQPVDLVIDHSVQVDEFRSKFALARNIEIEYERNAERYAFLRWAQSAFRNFTVVPPGTGIVHQVNLEYLARVAFVSNGTGTDGADLVYPDTLVGTDSHTTMINGLGVLGWGVGGIEAEAAMLGQPVSMLIPQVTGFEFTGRLREGATATDLVLTVTEMLREQGVVGRFVEFFGTGLTNLPLADRATIGNMSPEFGSTCAIFPIDAETLRYLELTGRPRELIELVEAYYSAQGLLRTDQTIAPHFTDVLHLDLADVVPSIAGPHRPQDRIALSAVKHTFRAALEGMAAGRGPIDHPVSSYDSSRSAGEGFGTAHAEVGVGTATALGNSERVIDGSVVIAAITSCTNTSNPSVMIAAGLIAKKACERGMQSKPWVKTSLAPGSKVVTRYFEASGLNRYLDELGFQTVGYGCTTCIGNSGPLPSDITRKIEQHDLVVAAVLSGNRNFEGRIHGEVKMNFLASPPLVVAYALAGHMDWDPHKEPLGVDHAGEPVYLADIWPSQEEISEVMGHCVKADMFHRTYAEVYAGDDHWRSLPTPKGDLFEWNEDSTYIKRAPYFEDMPEQPAPITDIHGARCLVKFGDSITTDHISPAGEIKPDSPAGRYLVDHGVEKRAFNSYGSRRGNHDAMVRGTFANVRLRNQLAPGTEGGVTRHLPDGEQSSIFEASERYLAEGVPLLILAGKEYGSGSSRDWAAKGPSLLGVRAVICESYERIHRSNLVGMGILPLQFKDGESTQSLNLTGEETFDITGVADLFTTDAPDNGLPGDRIVQIAATGNSSTITFGAVLRIDTPQEVRYYQHGGILQYVLRSLRGESPARTLV